jgi:hypothetical protein
MIKFFLAGIIALGFCTLFLIQNSFTSLTPPIKSTTSSTSDSHLKDNSEDDNKRTAVNTTKNQFHQTEETSNDKINNTNTAEEKHNEYHSEQNPKDVNNKQQASKEGKEFHQQPPDKLEKDILQDIKSLHGEVVIKKIKNEKSVTILTTEDKRITGLQMPKGQAPVAGESYIDNKNSKAETGIHLPNNKQQPVSTESYIPGTAEPRY